MAALWLVLVSQFWFLCDDAYISFRYARNLAQGLGITYHPLDQPPVEGYSHLLWVLWLGLGDRLGIAPEHLAPWTSVTAGLLLLRDAARYTVRLGLHPAATAAAVTFLATMPAFFVWSTGGLETMPAALCGWCLFRGLFGPARLPGTVTALAAVALCLLRPEGPVVVASLLLLAAVTRRWSTASVPGRTTLVRLAIAAAVAVVAQLVFRFVVYGDWVPNTVRAKGDFAWFRAERGLDYIASFGLVFPGVIVCAGMGWLAWRGPYRSLAVASLGLAATHVAFAVRVGGDFMPMGRFLVPTLPLLALWLALGVDVLLRRGRRGSAAVLVVAATIPNLLPAFDWHVLPATVRHACDFRWGLPTPATEYSTWRDLRDGARSDELLARALNLHTSPNQKLIREAIGVVGYRSHLRVLDTFGLVTKRPNDDFTWLPRGTPGHDRFLPWTVFLDQQPDYLFAHLALPSEPVTCAMLATPLAISPLAQRIEVVRWPVDEPDAQGRTVELRLLRFIAYDDPTAPIAPLLRAVEGIEPAAPDALERLRQRLPTAQMAPLVAPLRAPGVAERLAPHGGGQFAYGHVADPTSRTYGFWIDAVRQAGPGAAIVLPQGKIVCAVALSGTPLINGHEPGWIVVPPTTNYQDQVTGGTALLLQFVPGQSGQPTVR